MNGKIEEVEARPSQVLYRKKVGNMFFFSIDFSFLHLSLALDVGDLVTMPNNGSVEVLRKAQRNLAYRSVPEMLFSCDM